MHPGMRENMRDLPINGFHGLDRLSRDSSDINYLLISQYIILILTCAVISAQNETKPEVI